MGVGYVVEVGLGVVAAGCIALILSSRPSWKRYGVVTRWRRSEGWQSHVEDESTLEHARRRHCIRLIIIVAASGRHLGAWTSMRVCCPPGCRQREETSSSTPRYRRLLFLLRANKRNSWSSQCSATITITTPSPCTNDRTAKQRDHPLTPP